jgi:DNA-binding NarL/FixJ family response regulator
MNKTMLVREKDVIWKKIQNSLKDNGYSTVIVEAKNAVDAFNTYRHLNPDIVLFDAEDVSDMRVGASVTEVLEHFGIGDEHQLAVVLTADGELDSVLNSFLSGWATAMYLPSPNVVHHIRIV